MVQRNLVFVIGLSPRLADPEVLKKNEYFCKYGKIYKVVINNHTIYNGAQVKRERDSRWWMVFEVCVCILVSGPKCKCLRHVLSE